MEYIEMEERTADHYRIRINKQLDTFGSTLTIPLTLYQKTNFSLPNWKNLQTIISIFFLNGRKFFKQLENTVGKGEIARNEQFLLFPQCFQKNCTADT